MWTYVWVWVTTDNDLYGSWVALTQDTVDFIQRQVVDHGIVDLSDLITKPEIHSSLNTK